MPSTFERRRPMRSRSLSIVTAALALVALLQFPDPFEDPANQFFAVIAIAKFLIPAFPLGAIMIVELRGPHDRKGLQLVPNLALMTVVVAGSLLTAFFALLSASGGLVVLAHGAALTFSLCLAIGWLLMPTHASDNGLSALATWGLLALSCWSLAVGVRVGVQASLYASGRDYCLANHRSNAVLESLASLRGFSLYTTGGGYKLGDHWYFHGLLLVKSADKVEVYNWSPRQFSFKLIENPERLIASPSFACDPQKAFVASLPLI